jgi:hypothetical protein
MKNFLNDSDGLSAKDYLLLVSTSIFFLFIVIGLIMAMFNRSFDDNYLALLDMVAPVIMTVVGGVMGVQAVETFSNRNSRKEKETEETEYESYK